MRACAMMDRSRRILRFMPAADLQERGTTAVAELGKPAWVALLPLIDQRNSARLTTWSEVRMGSKEKRRQAEARRPSNDQAIARIRTSSPQR